MGTRRTGLELWYGGTHWHLIGRTRMELSNCAAGLSSSQYTLYSPSHTSSPKRLIYENTLQTPSNDTHHDNDDKHQCPVRTMAT